MEVTNPTVVEADADTTDATFTVTLTSPEATTVTLDYETVPGDPAHPVDDFLPQTGQVEFLAGETTKTVPVPVVGDTVDEPTELFFLKLTGPAIPDPDGLIGTGEILDDDATLSIADVSVAEGSAGTTNAEFTVTASSADSGDITVDFATANGTATAPFDFTTTNGTLTFAEGSGLTQPITVPVVGDTVEEARENFLVTLTNPTMAAIVDGEGQGTIIDDDFDAFPLPPLDIGPGGGDENPSVQSRVLRGLTLVPSKRRVSKSSLVRLNGLLRVSGGPVSCRSRQKIAIQRRKAGTGRFQTFEVAVTARAGSFKTSTRPVRTYQYRARVSQTARCMGATSKAAKIVVRKRSKGGSARR